MGRKRKRLRSDHDSTHQRNTRSTMRAHTDPIKYKKINHYIEYVNNKALACRLTPARKTHLDEFAQQHNWQLNAHDDDEALHGLDSNWVEFQNRPIKRGELKEIQNLVLY